MLLSSNQGVITVHFLMYQMVQSRRVVVRGAIFPGFLSRVEFITDAVRTYMFQNKAVTEVFPAQAWRHFRDRTLTGAGRGRFIFSGELVLWLKQKPAPQKGWV